MAQPKSSIHDFSFWNYAKICFSFGILAKLTFHWVKNCRATIEASLPNWFRSTHKLTNNQAIAPFFTYHSPISAPSSSICFTSSTIAVPMMGTKEWLLLWQEEPGIGQEGQEQGVPRDERKAPQPFHGPSHQPPKLPFQWEPEQVAAPSCCDCGSQNGKSPKIQKCAQCILTHHINQNSPKCDLCATGPLEITHWVMGTCFLLKRCVSIFTINFHFQEDKNWF